MSGDEEFPTAPYPGLRPFNPMEWPIFFGREKEIVELITLLGERKLLLVHGGSGSGKSSVVRAGLIPAIARDYELAGRPFRYAIMRPLEGPIARLAALLSDLLPNADVADSYDWWSDQLIFAPDILEIIDQRLAAAGIDCFCLLIDQFEETLHWQAEFGRSDVQLLVDFLARIATSDARGEQRFFVILTMRSDYLKDFAQFDSFNRVINRCQYFLANLDERGIYSAIVEPARMFGGSVSGACTDRLRFSAAGNIDPLPTLQHALMRMAAGKFEDGRDGWEIGIADLERVGGLDNAISQHADEIYQAVIDRHGDGAARGLDWLFRSLIELDAGNRARRRPVTAGRLRALTGFDAATLDQILYEFARPGNNLLVISRSDPDPANHIVDLSHEAIIRSWWRMHDREENRNLGWQKIELQTKLAWQYLAVAARAHQDGHGELLGVAATRDRWRAFDRLREHPERARRYLVAPEGRPDVADEPEWLLVADFMEASRKDAEQKEKRFRRWSMQGIAFALTVFTILAVTAYMIYANSEIFSKSTEKLDNEASSGSDLLKRSQTNAVGSQLQLSNVDGVLLKSSEKGSPIASQAKYWIWIGNDARTPIFPPGEPCWGTATLKPSALEPNQKFVVCSNIVVRTAYPTHADQVPPTAAGVVVAGTTVSALSRPIQVAGAAEPQYWVPVDVQFQNFPTLRIANGTRMSDTDQAVLARLITQLTTRGYQFGSLDGARPAQIRPIVYYCRNDKELDKAKRLAGSVNSVIKSMFPDQKDPPKAILEESCDKDTGGSQSLTLSAGF
jgi:hypothetical protein